MKAYAGIGSRQTPADVLDLMAQVGAALQDDGWTLRTGGADGADQAFATWAESVELYLPWPGFNGLDSAYDRPQSWAYPIAEQHHPAWERCSRGAKALHARNVHQVLGYDEGDEPSKFVLCWTVGAQGGGGTGQAIRIAKAHGVPMLDLADPDVRRRVEAWL